MIEVEILATNGFEAAIQGMRNPMNSWDKSDSGWTFPIDLDEESVFFIGPEDMKLAMRLASNGPVHGKFKRMMIVWMNITAPLYWWKEFDTYKVGTVANSCSTMHKIHSKEFTLDDFSHEQLSGTSENVLKTTIETLNMYRNLFNKNKENSHFPEDAKFYWWQMIQLLPSSYNQLRTVMLNYEVLTNIYEYRKDHKLDEWRKFCDICSALLPYPQFFTGAKVDET